MAGIEREVLIARLDARLETFLDHEDQQDDPDMMDDYQVMYDAREFLRGMSALHVVETDTCERCRHRTHGAVCFNMASDNDCDCSTPAPSGVHFRCDCVPDLGPEHCHVCGDDRGRPIAWADAHPAPVDRDAVAREIKRHSVVAVGTLQRTDDWSGKYVVCACSGSTEWDTRPGAHIKAGEYALHVADAVLRAIEGVDA